MNPHRLNALYEEAPEGIGLRGTMNLGTRIRRAMRLRGFNNRKNQRTPKARIGGLRPGPGLNTAPIPKNPRHRKFFGIDKPQQPY